MVFNVMKDGTEITDITGHVVKVQEAEVVYLLINKINEGRKNED